MKKNLLLHFTFFVVLFFSASLAQAQCTTPTISGLSPTYCLNSPGNILSAVPPGGMFQGPGVVGNSFNPALAGSGTKTVTYGTCTSSYALLSSTTTGSGLSYSILPTSGSAESSVSLGDDQITGLFSIGFPFLFYCTTYTSFVISSNGFISFNPSVGNGCCSGQALPNSSTSLDNMIAAHWADLNPGNGGSITYATLGTAPNRTLFVNYSSVPFFSGGGTVNSQIRLMETSNIIEIHTGNISSNTYAMTQGIENAGGTAATPVPGRNANTGWVSSGDAQRFTPVLTCISTVTTFVSPTSVSVTGSPSVCAGASTTLTALGNTSYTWTGGTSSNNASVVVNPTSNTTYSVAATNSFGCIANAAINVTVFAGTPTMAVTTSTNSTCLGKTVTLTATGAITYSWNNNVTNGVSFTPTATSNYIVTGFNACGTSTVLTTVSVVPYAVTAIVSPSVVCAGNSATFNAVSAANLYTWMPSGANTQSVILGTSSTQIYTVTASDGTCVGMATVNLVANPVPTVVASPSLVTVCSGEPVNLNASGALTYTWNPGNTTGSAITVTPNVPTAYQVVGTNSLGCTGLANVAVITNPSPTVNLVANFNLICPGDPVNITVSGASNYTWNTGSNSTSLSVNPNITTMYSVIGDLNGCTNTASVTIAVFSPTLSVTGNTSICSGQMATLTASGANTYAWSNGVNNAVNQVSPSSTTLYTLSALSTSAGINCPSSGSIQVTVKPNPTITATPSRTTMCKNETNTITAAGASTYTWSNGANNSNIVFTPTLVTTNFYTVTGTSSVGCSSSITVQVKVNSCTGIENFSNSNDLLSVYPNPNNGSFLIKFEKDMKVKIVNELGQLIKLIDQKDGNTSESVSDLAAGVYFVIGEKNNQLITQKIIVQ